MWINIVFCPCCMLLLWNVVFVVLLSASYPYFCSFLHLYPCFTCSSVHTSTLHPLLLCYVNVCYVFDLPFVLLYFWVSNTKSKSVSELCHPLSTTLFKATNLIHTILIWAYALFTKFYQNSVLLCWTPSHHATLKVYTATLSISWVMKYSFAIDKLQSHI